MKILAKTFILAAFAVIPLTFSASAVTLDFNDSGNLGVSLGGGMTWKGVGGGHLYNEYWDNDDQIVFSSNTFVNSFQVNAMPWQGYGGGDIGFINVDALDSGGTSLWSQTLDLRSYTSWDNWLTVNVGVGGVSQLYFHAPGGSPHFNGFWPSVDNLVINEVPQSQASVPDGGTTLAMLGLALGGIGAVRRKLNRA